MNTYKQFYLTIIAFTSCISLTHDIASQLSKTQRSKHQIKIEEQIADQKSDLAFNATATTLGLLLFAVGITREVKLDATPLQNAIPLLAQCIGGALSGAGTYFGLRGCYKLKQLQNKLEACKSEETDIKSSAI